MSKRFENAYENVKAGLMPGGYDPPRGGILGYLRELYVEVFWTYFYTSSQDDEEHKRRLEQAINEASKYRNIGTFLADEKAQLDLIVGYGLVAADRFCKRYNAHEPPEKLLFHWEQLVECREYVTLFERDAKVLTNEVARELSKRNRVAALARHRKDPKQRAKAFVYECWQAWRDKPEQYPSAAAFARAMRDKQPDLVSEKNIADWVRAWRREAM